MQCYYGQAAAIEPDPWAGFRGYSYLYFYRDYPRAIAYFNLTDSVTGTISFSQGQSHEYMRGIAYYGLKDYPQALHFLSNYIDVAIDNDGEEWVGAIAVLYRALS
jgi:tetratricopeptide (TPR) repeat protein